MRNKDHILSGTRPCLPKHRSGQAARLSALVRAMCRPRAVPGLFDRRFPVAKIEHGHRRQAHQAPVPIAMRIGTSTVRVTCLLEMAQGRGHGQPDLKTLTSTAQAALSHPFAVVPYLVGGVESAMFDETRGRHSAIDASSVHCPG
jgi:hypothetical protein